MELIENVCDAIENSLEEEDDTACGNRQKSDVEFYEEHKRNLFD